MNDVPVRGDHDDGVDLGDAPGHGVVACVGAVDEIGPADVRSGRIFAV